MSHTLSAHPRLAPARAGSPAQALPYWNPYLVGFLLGLVLLATYAVTARGLGATAAFAAISSWLVGLGSVAHVEANAVHLRYWNEGAPLLNWTLFLLAGSTIGAFLSGWQGRRLSFSVERGPHISDGTRLTLAFFGGFVAAFGAKIAKGCTSGQALTGGSMLNVGSLVFMLAVFAGAYGLAYFVRKVAVMLPLSSTFDFSTTASLALAMVLGLGFGFCLERAGFGSARKLTAVFYLWDMAVVKVMFTAIVTTMVGLFVLSSAGLMDLQELYLEPTNLAAQALGGLVFGAGFIIGGYCPGTAISAIATGRKDAMAFAGGMLAGVTAFAEFTPGIDAWIQAGSLGEMTLPSLTGIGMGWWALAFVAFLAFAGWGMSRLEQRFAHLRPQG